MAAKKATDLTEEQNERVRLAIRAYMAERGLNGTAMAKELDVSNASLSNILSGKNGAGTRTAMRLAQLLGMPYETFISAARPKPPPSQVVVRDVDPGDPRAAGFRRFAEFVEDEMPELLEQLARFRAERFEGVAFRASRSQETMTRLDWETQWKADFRAWRRAQEAGAVTEAFGRGARVLDDDE